MKFSITDFFSKCDQILSKLQIWSHLLKKTVTENFIFCAVIRLALALKKCAKTDIKGLRFCLTLLAFLIFLKIYYARLLAEKAFTKQIYLSYI